MNQKPQSCVNGLNHNKTVYQQCLESEKNMINGLRFVFICVSSSLLLGSCALFAKPEPSDFEARDADFAGYSSWALTGTTTGASDQLEMAHDAKNPAVTRYIFVKDNAQRKSDGQFPVGTIIAKQSRLSDGTLVGVATAMVKRAKGFSPAAGNWEWFMLEPKTGTIIKNPQGEVQRGKISMCIACHTDGEGNDFTFPIK